VVYKNPFWWEGVHHGGSEWTHQTTNERNMLANQLLSQLVGYEGMSKCLLFIFNSFKLFS